MSDQTQINKQLRSCITELMQLPPAFVRPANQNAPAGGLEAEYMTVLITNVTGERGHQTRSSIDGSSDLLIAVDAQRKATASIQSFGDGSFDQLITLNALLDSDWSQWIFQQANIGLVMRRGPVDLTAIVPANLWQRRAQMEIDFYFIAHAEVRVPTFSSFEWTIYVNEDGSAHYEVIVP
jgi:hypothetical protein